MSGSRSPRGVAQRSCSLLTAHAFYPRLVTSRSSRSDPPRCRAIRPCQPRRHWRADRLASDLLGREGGVLAGGPAVAERDEHHPVTRLRKRVAVPGAVKRREQSTLVAWAECVSGVERQGDRRPVPGKGERPDPRPRCSGLPPFHRRRTPEPGLSSSGRYCSSSRASRNRRPDPTRTSSSAGLLAFTSSLKPQLLPS